MSHRLSLLARCSQPSLILQAPFVASRRGIPAFWHNVQLEKKTNLVLLPDNGTGLGYVFIFQPQQESWWAGYTDIQNTKSKKEIHRFETLCDRRDPDLLDATMVGFPIWIRTALHLHHRSNARTDR